MFLGWEFLYLKVEDIKIYENLKKINDDNFSRTPS